MTRVNLWGLAWVMAGGIFNATFILPMKSMKAWRWENIWLPYSVVAMIIAPWVLALATVPSLGSVYQGTSWAVLMKVALFGFGWGVGSTLFGVGITMVGMALGYALILGITASLGSLLPLAVLDPGRLLTRQGYLLITGTALVIGGLALLSIAGRRRERETSALTREAPKSRFGLGLVVCILSGIFSAMLNFSFTFGREIQLRSAALGASVAASGNAIWCVALGAGFLANAGYCVYLLQKDRTWHLFLDRSVPFIYWGGALFMGVTWLGGIAAYGVGAALLGPLGGVLGWPVLMAVTVIGANFLGALTGEWRGTSRISRAYWWAGLVFLLLAVYAIGLGSAA